MILVAIVVELLEEYTLLVARVLEHLLADAPFPRRLRFHMLRSLAFASAFMPRRTAAPPRVLDSILL
ncbi:hypothetical protein KSP40_PGU000435 [Platanthera guangdongensis]|uniref:Uncharacterized protein n=1 Tax=Platanthera guangdongensis TaxID=2320717 RepID=A0ABR2MID3_9ASPA